MAKQRNAVESCREGFEAFKAFKAFKRCWKRARWQFQSPIETGCGAGKCQIAASKANRNRSWRLGRSHGKAAKRRRNRLGGF